MSFCVSLHCRFDQQNLLRISYEEIISSQHSFFSFFYKTHVSLPYNSVGNTAFCSAKHAAVLTFRRHINAAKAPLTPLLAAKVFFASISAEHTLK